MPGQALLSTDARNTEGILLLAIVAVEFGGTYMLRIVRGREPVRPAHGLRGQAPAEPTDGAG